MNTKCMALVACFMPVLPVFSQNYFYNERYYDSDILYEFSLGAGIMNCFTDLGGTRGAGKGFIKDLNLTQTKPVAGLQLGVLYRSVAGLRLDLSRGTVAASDAVLKDDQSVAHYRYRRNLHFRSIILEAALLAEIYPLPILFPPDEHKKVPRFSPYLMGGLGVFRFNPQANLNGEWVYLQTLRTEGQGFHAYPDRKPYSLTQVNFPAGIGLRYEVSAMLNLRVEVLHRFLRTDYLDDVSTTYIDQNQFFLELDAPTAQRAFLLSNRQAAVNSSSVNMPGSIRGNPGKNDAYFSVMVKLGLLLGREKR